MLWFVSTKMVVISVFKTFGKVTTKKADYVCRKVSLLTKHAIAIYYSLLARRIDKTNTATLSLYYICSATGFPKTTVVRSIQKLETVGLITTIKTRGRGNKTVFTFVEKDQL